MRPARVGCAAALALVCALACHPEAVVGPPTVLTLRTSQARTHWLAGWGLETPALVEKNAGLFEQARGSEAVFQLVLPVRPVIRGSARLRSGQHPYTAGVPILGRVTLAIAADGIERRVVDYGFGMPGEFSPFAWNESLDEFGGKSVTLTLRVDPGEAVEGAALSHRRLRVAWTQLRVEGFAPVPPD